MNRNCHHYYGRSHTKSRPETTKPRVSVTERRARKARKQLLKLFPHLVPQLHKGVSAVSIYQHAAMVAQAPTGRDIPFKK